VRFVIGMLLIAWGLNSHAHQPVMDMAPRWADGYGFQVRTERFGSDELKNGSDDIPNPGGAERYVNTTWLEGVYTFNRTIRTTVKIPYVNQKRTIPMPSGNLRQTDKGLGDVIIGLPLKKYKNAGSVTQNWGITPSLRMPTGDDSGDFPISDGSWDVGLSLSYAWENPLIYQLYDLYYWKQGSGSHGMQSGDSWGLDINVGLHPWHSNETDSGVFLLWDVSAYHEEPPDPGNLTTAAGGDRVQTGPVLIYYWDNLMVRGEYKFLAYEDVDGIGLSRGDEFSIAIGFTF
jgi:hypothetical protein